MNQYVILVCGLNIRDQNRISLDEQRLALGAIAGGVELTRVVGDKGSYLVASRHPAGRVSKLILNALLTRRADLKIPGAAVTSPNVVADGLSALANTLVARYGNAFTRQDHGIKLGDDTRRAGLALPLFPSKLPPDRAIFHKIKERDHLRLGQWLRPCSQARSGERPLGEGGYWTCLQPDEAI